MILLHNIGVSPSDDPNVKSNYNTIEEILACNEPLSFDGVYKSVYEHRKHWMFRNVTLFVAGDHVGKDNSFDVGMPREQFCTWEEICELVNVYHCRLGWHSKSHRDLTTLPYEEIVKEVTPPQPMRYFAYPYGRFNDDVVKAVQEAGYKDAWSVTQGDDTQFKRNRKYLCTK